MAQKSGKSQLDLEFESICVHFNYGKIEIGYSSTITCKSQVKFCTHKVHSKI